MSELLSPDYFLEDPDSEYVVEVHATAVPLAVTGPDGAPQHSGWRTERRVYLNQRPFYLHTRLCELLRRGTINDDPVGDARRVGALLMGCGLEQVPVRYFYYRRDWHNRYRRLEEADYNAIFQRGSPQSQLLPDEKL